jgi:hypothetical protein
MSEAAWWWEIKAGRFFLRQPTSGDPSLIGLLRPGAGSLSITLRLIFVGWITGK